MYAFRFIFFFPVGPMSFLISVDILMASYMNNIPLYKARTKAIITKHRGRERK